jgi:glycosyltransferase involved in cell wall biosynthesis
MIVKNEEKHIERALAWAKGFAFEQIVVDTGSTDRTVELAKKMGAKVVHFEWINDFSAAKNFAMDQAKGNWIAILDADEYMLKEDVKELMAILKKIQSDPALAKQYDAITNSWVQLDDNDNVIAIITNQRVFRNSPELRYEGKIHESIKLKGEAVNATNLRIMHTGYAQSTYNEADKRERNIRMLKNELERDPEDPDIMIYLADSLKADGKEESREEAEKLYLKALRGKRKANIIITQLAYDFLIRYYIDDKNKADETMALCNEAIATLPGNIDYNYYRAVLNNKKGNYKAAWEDLSICERAFTTATTLPSTRILLPSPIPLFFQLKMAAKGMGDEQEIIKSGTIVNAMLIDGKDNTDTIGAFIKAMLLYGISEDDTLKELAEIYDINDPKELLFIARAAKDSGAIGFTRKIMDIAKEIMN